MLSMRACHPLRFLVLACAPLLTGCPLPVAHTETPSPRVIGSISFADGRPAAAIDIALSGYGDVGCTHAALRTRSDSAGHFVFAPRTTYHKVTWIIPNLDVMPPSFQLCATVHDTTVHAYRGSGSLTDSARTDSITCIAWEWQQRPRVSCTGRQEHGFITGGHWTTADPSSAGGFYRLYLTEEPTVVKGYKKDHPQDRPYVYVQWVEPRPRNVTDDTASRYEVRTSISLPIDRDRIRGLYGLELWRREAHWMASMRGYKHAFMNDFAKTELVFQLGAPGEATLVAGP